MTDLTTLLEIAKAYNRLGGAVQEQMDDLVAWYVQGGDEDAWPERAAREAIHEWREPRWADLPLVDSARAMDRNVQ